MSTASKTKIILGKKESKLSKGEVIVSIKFSLKFIPNNFLFEKKV